LQEYKQYKKGVLMNNLVSVIISTYNRKESVIRAIESVLNQTYKNIELIVVDDASSDKTSDFLNQYFENLSDATKDSFLLNKDETSSFSNIMDSNAVNMDTNYLKKYKYKLFLYYDVFKEPIKLISLKKNTGISVARNIGISLAKGALICFLDSDDIFLEHKIAKQVALYNKNKFKLCHTEEIWIRNGIRVNAMKKHQKKGGYIFLNCLPFCVISPSSVMIEKSIFMSIGFFDEKLPVCEDYDLWLRICLNNEVSYIDEKLIVKYGGHKDQLSKKYWGMDRFRIKALLKLIKTNNLDAEKLELIKKTIITKANILKKGSLKRLRFFNYIKYSFLVYKLKS